MQHGDPPWLSTPCRRVDGEQPPRWSEVDRSEVDDEKPSGPGPRL